MPRRRRRIQRAWSRSAAAAEQSFLQARQAVDTFTQLGEEELISQPTMYQLRRKFLETALDYYETFLDQHHNDSAVQAELVATRQWVAKIVDELTTLSSVGPLMLLADERVQEELGIGVEQQAKIDGLIEDLWSQRSKTAADQQLTREEHSINWPNRCARTRTKLPRLWALYQCAGCGKSLCNSKDRSPLSAPRSSRRWL